MHFSLYKFQWTEWDKITILSQGTGFYFAKETCGGTDALEKMIRIFINKPDTADITVDEITGISARAYELETGEPYHL
jgi:hypothetical protein